MLITQNLSILLNIITQKYFSDARCVLQFGDARTAIPTIPTYLAVQNVSLCEQDELYCNHFLLVLRHNAVDTLRRFELELRDCWTGNYGERKYILVLPFRELRTLFTLSTLHYIRDILIIEIDEQNEEQNVFRLYTHQFIGTEGMHWPLLLDVWHAENQSFTGANGWCLATGICTTMAPNLFPDKSTNGYGRALSTYTMYSDRENSLPYVAEMHIMEEFCTRFNFNIRQVAEGYHDEDVRSEMSGHLLMDDGDPLQAIEFFIGNVLDMEGIRKHRDVDRVITAYLHATALVPLPKLAKQSWFSYSSSFDAYSWTLFALTYGVIYHLVRYRMRKTRSRRRIGALDFAGIAVCQPATYHGDDSYVRYLLASTSMLAILFATMYNSRLLGALIVPRYENQIETAQQLIDSDLTLIGQMVVYGVLWEENNPRIERFLRRLRYPSEPERLQLLKEYKYALQIMRHESDLQYDGSKLALSEKRIMFLAFFTTIRDLNLRTTYVFVTLDDCLQDNLLTMNTVLLLRGNSVYTSLFYKFIQHVRAAGLIEYWERMLLRKTLLFTLSLNAPPIIFDTDKLVLQWQHLKGAFALLFIGYVIGLLTFLCEHLTSMYLEKQIIANTL